MCFVIGTKSGMVMQERKQEISCRKVEMQADIFDSQRPLADRRMKKGNIWVITLGAEIA